MTITYVSMHMVLSRGKLAGHNPTPKFVKSLLVLIVMISLTEPKSIYISAFYDINFLSHT